MRILTWNVNGIKTLKQYHPWNALGSYEGIIEELGADIVCLQEPKITRAQMDKSLACMTKYDSFFSFFRRTPPKGIHGTAIFTKKETCVPLKAEEGIGRALVPSNLVDNDRIGGYPLGIDVDLEEEEMKDLDLEGRTTVCDFGLFVLINLYCPHETNEHRLVFKNYFNAMVDRRARNLIKAGREVIVIGDLNVCAAAIDTAEPDVRNKDAKKEGLDDFTEHSPRKWFKEFVGPNGPMIDITRRYHPKRTGMYTCWNTKIDARPSNYGTRIDYVLVTPGLLPWVSGSDILPAITGSDHCPVYVDLHDKIDIPGRGTVSLWDEMNPGRSQDAPPVDPPQFATRFLDEFSGKQKLLSNFFGKKSEIPVASSSQLSDTTRSLIPPPSSSVPTVSASAPVATSSSATALLTITSASQPASRSISASSVAKGKGKAKEEEEKPVRVGQQSISSFFKPPPKPPKPVKKKKKAASTPTIIADSASPSVSDSASLPPSQSTSATTITSIAESLDLTQSADEDEPPYDWQESEGSMSAASNASASASGSRSGASSAAMWTSLFAPKPVPNCRDHNEPAKLWTVMKPGLNKGRRFYLCSRPVGPGYDKGQAKLHVNPEWRCNFFEWETSVKRPAAGSSAGISSKKQKT